MAKSSDEMFYLKPDGTKADDVLHAELLEGPDADAAAKASLQKTVGALRAKGVPEEAIQQLYGPI